MEEKKSHPALPSNYVTLAQLQERWLRKKERIEKDKELQEKQEQPQQKLQQNRQERDRDQHRAKRTTQTQRRASDFHSRTGNRFRKAFLPKILSVSQTNRFAIELSRKDHEKLEAKVEILGDNADKDSKDNKLEKRQKVKQNQRADKDMDMGTTQGTEEATTEEGKVENFEVKRGREKTAIKNELNHEVEENVEAKFRGLSMRCESDKRNARFRRSYTGFGSTHGHYGNGGSHSYGGYQWRFSRREVPKPRGNTMVWVRKEGSTSGGNVAAIETSSGSY
ncbi:hypothetical protein L6164_024572 [Bauhinia variegata]|uniref:Uncharacterized protein n=1 Tax=Bauhinia variegata TaxID=167791 RepID=A0ACB9M0E1_BAUVA|nr:hypothetical protein L6164_024572 [Bauhinia variegata]